MEWRRPGSGWRSATTLTRSIAVDSHQRDRAQRSSAALGLGYFLNQRTVLSVDLAGGTSPAGTSRTEVSTGDLVQTGIQNSRFVSANLGVQTKVSSHLFLNASLLAIWQAYNLSQAVYPDSFGEYSAHYRPLFAADCHGLQAAAASPPTSVWAGVFPTDFLCNTCSLRLTVPIPVATRSCCATRSVCTASSPAADYLTTLANGITNGPPTIRVSSC